MSVLEVIQRNTLTSILLTRGYNVFLPMTDQGIDFIIHRECDNDLKLVQQKSRWTIDRKYLGRNLWIAFQSREQWYLAPHETMVAMAREAGTLDTASWREGGSYHRANLSAADTLVYARWRLDPDLEYCEIGEDR